LMHGLQAKNSRRIHILKNVTRSPKVHSIGNIRGGGHKFDLDER
jgi:hypothetical protein